MAEHKKELILFSLVVVALLLIFFAFGSAYTVRMLVEIACFTILALGLTIQWGYAGLFNAGVMGFVAVGGFMTMLISFPINNAFWHSDAPIALGLFLVDVLVVIAILAAISQLYRIGVSQKLTTICLITGIVFSFFYFNSALEPVARLIEREADFIGGFGLPVILGWAVGGVVAAVVAFGIGKACLGLRSDYLAIATLGFAEIIKAILKNADWLSRGTLTVSPLPWPVPTPNELGFVAARGLYFVVVVVIIVALFILLQRAYRAPWGRMMRAIRDNDIAAAAMGKDVNFRRLQIFVLGSGMIGLGGAVLVTFNRIFDPAGFTPLHHTFIVWVMVLVGGSGNNLGTIFGAIAIYMIWIMSEPVTLFLFEIGSHYGSLWFGWESSPDLTLRALQSRLFIIGLTITLALRYIPQGMIPEKVGKVS